MDCREVRKWLDTHTGENVTPEDRADFERHLKICPSCAAEVNREQRLTALLSTVSAPEIPADLTQRIVNRIPRKPQGRYVHLAAALQWWWQDATPALRAAAVFILVVGLGLGSAVGLKITGKPVTDDRPMSVYGLDNLAGVPDGSLEQAYLTLLETPEGGR